jgi:hypothetical protein
MRAKRRIFIVLGVSCLLLTVSDTGQISAQRAAAPDDAAKPQVHQDPLGELTPENRDLFHAMREAAKKGQDADVLADGKRLLPALQTGTPLTDFVTLLTANAATEAGETSYALSLVKPLVEAHPNDWHVATLLARLYTESGEKALRDQQVARVVALHKQSTDPDFIKLHIFPIQKINLHSGYAVFLYPFEPLTPHNIYLVALIYTNDGKQEYRIEIDSEDVDQALFKPKKHGDRRFSIDSYRQNETNPNWPESQALYGFIDGLFDYDTMRDRIVTIANDGESKHK